VEEDRSAQRREVFALSEELDVFRRDSQELRYTQAEAEANQRAHDEDRRRLSELHAQLEAATLSDAADALRSEVQGRAEEEARAQRENVVQKTLELEAEVGRTQEEARVRLATAAQEIDDLKVEARSVHVELQATNAAHKEDRKQLSSVEEDRSAQRREVFALSEELDVFRRDSQELRYTQAEAKANQRAHDEDRRRLSELHAPLEAATLSDAADALRSEVQRLKSAQAETYVLQERADERARAHFATAVQEIDDFRAEARRVQMELEATNALHEEDRQQFRGVEEDRDTMRNEVVALSEAADAFRNEIEQFDSTQGVEKERTNDEIRSHLAALAQEKVNLQTEVGRIESELQATNVVRDEDRRQLERVCEERDAQRREVAVFEETADTLHSEIWKLEAAQQEAKVVKERTNDEAVSHLAAVAQEKGNLQTEVERIKSELLATNAVRDEDRRQLERLGEERDAQRSEVAVFEETADALHSHIWKLESAQQETRVVKERADEEARTHLKVVSQEKSELLIEFEKVKFELHAIHEAREQDRRELERVEDERDAQSREVAAIAETADALRSDAIELEGAQEENKALKDKVSALAEELERLQSARLEESTRWEQTRCQMERSLADARRAEESLLKSGRQVAELTEQLEQLRVGAQESEERAVAAEASRVAAEGKNSQLTRDLELKAGELRGRDERILAVEQRNQELEDQLDVAKAAQEEAAAAAAAARGEAARGAASAAALRREVEQLKEELERAGEERRGLQRRLREGSAPQRGGGSGGPPWASAGSPWPGGDGQGLLTPQFSGVTATARSAQEAGSMLYLQKIEELEAENARLEERTLLGSALYVPKIQELEGELADAQDELQLALEGQKALQQDMAAKAEVIRELLRRSGLTGQGRLRRLLGGKVPRLRGRAAAGSEDDDLSAGGKEPALKVRELEKALEKTLLEMSELRSACPAAASPSGTRRSATLVPAERPS